MPEPSTHFDPGVTVLANLAVDRIDGAPPSPGGCATFAIAALEFFRAGRIVARGAAADLPLFETALAAGATVIVDRLDAPVTSAFGLQYDGDDRVMTVDGIGPQWTTADVTAAQVGTTWVHLAPLLRSDFPAAVVAGLAAAGHRIAFDGQGLVRVPQLGPMHADRAFDPAILKYVSVLKLADDEAVVLTEGAPFDEAAATALAVPEILVTGGSAGCDLYVAGVRHHISPPWRVEGVQATGAGDIFTVAYVAARARGDEPVEAAEVASQLVSEQLQSRLESRASLDRGA